MTTMHTPPEADEAAKTEQPKALRSLSRHLRLTTEEDSIVRQAAAARRMTVTEFMVTAALKDAEQALIEPRDRTLAVEAFVRLAERLQEPERVVDALARALKEPRQVDLPG